MRMIDRALEKISNADPTVQWARTAVGYLFFIPILIACVLQCTPTFKMHSPIWLISYNNFAFDNLFLSLNDPTAQYIKVHSKARSMSCLCLYEEGMNNVDLYTILDNSNSSRFESLRLDMVAKDLGIGEKLHMPTAKEYRDDLASLVRYNMMDSQLIVEIFNILDVGSKILSRCNVMKSCFIDVVRGATGTMCSCMLSSYAVAQNKLLDWFCTRYIPDVYEGGRVYEPESGYYPRVAVVDFKSIYPSLILVKEIFRASIVH